MADFCYNYQLISATLLNLVYLVSENIFKIFQQDSKFVIVASLISFKLINLSFYLDFRPFISIKLCIILKLIEFGDYLQEKTLITLNLI